MRDDGERLRDILDAIERIERYQGSESAAGRDDELVAVWMEHHLRIVGEAVRRLSDELRANHPEVDWQGITGMRNILIHQYFEVDYEVVWATVDDDIPALKSQITGILNEMERGY